MGTHPARDPISLLLQAATQDEVADWAADIGSKAERQGDSKAARAAWMTARRSRANAVMLRALAGAYGLRDWQS